MTEEKVDYSEIPMQNLQRLLITETGKLYTAFAACGMLASGGLDAHTMEEAINDDELVKKIATDLVVGNNVVAQLLEVLEDRMASA